MNYAKQRKVCIVTGGNSGVGLMTSIGLAKADFQVFIACRSSSKARKAVDYIRKTTGNCNVEFLPLNLASLESVRNFVTLFEQKNIPLHLLVNNAGIFNHSGTTQEGFELIWGTNYLGHFLLTNLLLEKLKDSSPSRIIMVASDLALKPKSIDWHLFTKKTPLNFLELYSVSKLCLLLLTTELTRKLNNIDVTVNAVHPGFVQSNITIWHRLSKYLGLGLSPQKGAYSSLFCATSTDIEGVSGKFFDSKMREMPLSKLAQNLEVAQELWQRSLIWTDFGKQQNTLNTNYAQLKDEISGVYTLALDSQQIADIRKNICEQVLSKAPNKLFFVKFFQFLTKLQFGSLMLLLIQYWKKEFYMERHLDSPAVWRLCQDQELLRKLKEHLGEDLVLWRSEIWVNYPSQQLIPFWHQDSYPKLLEGTGKSINAYIALTDVNEFNGFEYIPCNYLKDNNSVVKISDPFSGNHFWKIGEDLEKKALPVVLNAGEFILFTNKLVHRSIPNSRNKVRVSITLRIIQPNIRVLPGYTSNYQQPVFL